MNMTLVCLLFNGCSASDRGGPCKSRSAIELADSVCLIFEDESLDGSLRQDIEIELRQAVAEIGNAVPLSDVRITVFNNPGGVIPEIGIGGYNPNEEEVHIRIDPGFASLEQSINEELSPMLAHELHHLMRRRGIGYGGSLLEAAVSEGLADHFSIEIYGIDPPIWSLALTGMELEEWLDTASETWLNTPYDHGAWFLGTSGSIPRWTGYAIGYKLVEDYLIANPGVQPSDLFSEPASSFMP